MLLTYLTQWLLFNSADIYVGNRIKTKFRALAPFFVINVAKAVH